MDCGRCGSWLESKSPDGLFGMDEEITCPECQTVNQIGIDGEEWDDDATAYVSHWTCKHGTEEDTPCSACDAEDAAAALLQGGTPT